MDAEQMTAAATPTVAARRPADGRASARRSLTIIFFMIHLVGHTVRETFTYPYRGACIL